MNIRKASRLYERWMAEHTQPVEADLAFKHTEMSRALFPFFRATFYRWVMVWADQCPELAAAPRVLAVGDLHVENFGTWRDVEGRLIWGINDFDEAHTAAYAIDLVRLAASAHLACQEAGLALHPRDACGAIVEGYRDALKTGGQAFVLAESHRWLRDMALNELRDPVVFWEKMQCLSDYKGTLSKQMRREFEAVFPERGLKYKLKRRVAGLGSLGHQRVVALAEWHGGFLAREAKALVPSASEWLAGRKNSHRLFCAEIVDRSIRVPDPFVRFRGNWLFRRLAPDCRRIELTHLPKYRDERRLLYSMGWEAANVHLGTPHAAQKVLEHLDHQPSRWLHKAAKRMVKATLRDWKEWKNG